MKTINDYAELVKEKHALNETIAPVEADETDASKAYAVGEQLILSGILYDVIAPISQHDVITTTGSGANIAPAGPISAKIQTLTNELDDEIETRATLGAHNLCSFNDSFTLVRGTGDTNRLKDISINSVPILDSYVVSFKVSNASNATKINLQIGKRNSSMTAASAVTDLSEGRKAITFTFSEEVDRLYFYLTSSDPSDATITISEIMITSPSDPSVEYTPYAMTNRELTEELTIKDVSGYSWDSAIDGNKDIAIKRYGAIVSIYGYFRSTTALAQYANILSGLPHCASGAAKSADIGRNMGMTLQNVDSATSKIVVDSATTADLQYAFNFVYLTDK